MLTDRSPFKAALNAFVAEDRTLEALGAEQVLRTLKTASTRIEARLTGV
jgi:hypothetical protein